MENFFNRGCLVLMVTLFLSGTAFSAPLKPGDPAPDFSLSALSGGTVRLSDYKGNIVVLGLFHICEPCKEQAEILEKIGQKLKAKGVKIVGVNASGNSREDVQAYVNAFETRVTFPYLIDPSEKISGLYSVRNTPNVYVLDQRGVIRFKGAFTGQADLEKVIATILD
jgi:cytochrome c biogenesis protein CcmG/thiol:disulfide interchange protein DsbE